MSENITELVNLLRQMEAMNSEIQGSAIISIQGLPIASALPKTEYGEEANDGIVSAMSAAIQSVSERAVQELSRGNLKRIMIEGDEGLIILSSNNKPNNDMDLESLAAMAASLFSKESISDYELLRDIEVNYKEKKIYITKLDENLLNEAKNIMFIIIIPPNIRYFKRKINKVKNKIKNFFII